MVQDDGGVLGQATVYLAHEGVREIDDLVKAAAGVSRYPVGEEWGFEGALFVQPHEASRPDWAAVLDDLAGATLPNLTTQLAGAALVARLQGRIFALAFGQGRHLLRSELLVEDFGLRVAENTVDPAAIRSIDGRAFERGVLLTRRQTSRPGRAESLGLQVDREMIRSITGRSRIDGGGRVHGGTSLGLSGDIDLRRLHAFGQRLLHDYSDNAYKEAFPQLDRLQALSPESSDARVLDGKLLDALKSPDYGSAYLAPPAILDWGDVSAFRFSTEPRTSQAQDLRLEDYLLSLGDPSQITEARLENDEVLVIARDSARTVFRWSVRRCIVWETQIEEAAYILAEGLWWRVDREYMDYVDSACQRPCRSPRFRP